MAAQFDSDGVHFLYPENWRLERDHAGDSWSVTVQSPETAFFLLTVNEDTPSTGDMLSTTLEAMKADYPDLESDEIVDTVAGQPAVGHDIRFTSLDLTNTCWTRAFYTGAGTVMVLCQCNDLESDVNEPVLRAICKSLKVDD